MEVEEDGTFCVVLVDGRISENLTMYVPVLAQQNCLMDRSIERPSLSFFQPFKLSVQLQQLLIQSL